ncbi:growth-regulating factor 3-like [Tripterygium wilfordii]|uniref:growth-regulating factor 3-like n=1 Tax=Tripterygium wilfordii TaxID=458696 RepID=UPI0018F83AB4|nr:growth-regulating factor 3-like [Tripterygium wilfordii]
MDFHLKQWRDQQHESENRNTAKMPKLLFDPHPKQKQDPSSGSDALPLFEPQLNSKTSNLSAFPDSPTRFPSNISLTFSLAILLFTNLTNFAFLFLYHFFYQLFFFRLLGMGSYFSLAQWQELELQALIYRYMLAGAAVPSELLNTLKRSLLQSAPYVLHYPLQHYSHYQPALFQAGYWGGAAMAPEPGRCRRTDGKKWRCSRDVVTGQKYCERHVHRGRNRSRKHVEAPTSTNTTTLAYGGSSLGSTNSTAKTGFVGNTFTISGHSPSTDLLQPNHSSSESKTGNKGLFAAHDEGHKKSDGHMLRHFFD